MQRNKILVFLTTILVLLSLLIQAHSNAGGPTLKNRQAVSQEWTEVLKNYPRVAAAYLEALEAVSEGARFAATADQKAFAVSAFHRHLVDLCDSLPLSKKPSFCETPQIVRQPPPCRSCAGVCAIEELAVDCSDCRQRRADAGCF